MEIYCGLGTGNSLPEPGRVRLGARLLPRCLSPNRRRRAAGPALRLLLPLIYPCRGDCFDADRTCDEMAESAAVTCAEQTCDASIQTARTTLLPCIQPCLDTEQSAVASCHTTLEACLTACGSS